MLAINSAPHLPILLLIKKRIRKEDSKFHATGQFLSCALKENITAGGGEGAGIDISRAEGLGQTPR